MSLVDYLAAPSPAPVIEEIDTLVSELRNKDAIVISGLFHCVPIMGRAADTIDSLRAALVEARELHRMQMVAIDVIAMCNTKPAMESWAIQKGNPNWTPTYDTVREAVEREMVQRERAEQAESALAAAKDWKVPHQNAGRPDAKPDGDGACFVCGLAWPDERETLEPHVCPPGFLGGMSEQNEQDV
jgi:hypothetical protein